MAYNTIYDTVAIALNGERFVICSGPSKGKRATLNNMRAYGSDVVEFFDKNGRFEEFEWNTERKCFVITDGSGVEIGIVKQESNAEKSRKEKARIIELENSVEYTSIC